MHGKDRTSININYFVFVWFLDNSYGPDVMTKYLHVGRNIKHPLEFLDVAACPAM